MFFQDIVIPKGEPSIFLHLVRNLNLPWVICFLRLVNFCQPKSRFPKDDNRGGSLEKLTIFDGIGARVSIDHNFTHLFGVTITRLLTNDLYSWTLQFVSSVNLPYITVEDRLVFCIWKNIFKVSIHSTFELYIDLEAFFH